MAILQYNLGVIVKDHAIFTVCKIHIHILSLNGFTTVLRDKRVLNVEYDTCAS